MHLEATAERNSDALLGLPQRGVPGAGSLDSPRFLVFALPLDFPRFALGMFVPGCEAELSVSAGGSWFCRLLIFGGILL